MQTHRKHVDIESYKSWSRQEPEVTFATEIIVLVACLGCAALAVAAVTGRLDEIGRRFFSALGL